MWTHRISYKFMYPTGCVCQLVCREAIKNISSSIIDQEKYIYIYVPIYKKPLY